MSKIYLMGYMGSGKSTIGKGISQTLDFEFIDLDNYISNKEGLSISEIFKQRGEVYFRRKEAKYLQELALTNENMVVALGGGTPCFGNNINIIHSSKDSASFYLKLSNTSLTERLKNEKENRPLINHLESKDEILEFISKHLFERSYFYSQAKYKINCDNLDIDTVQQRIISQLF